ncbi:alpha/beta hydrolase [Paraburkholderia hospita]|jgi:predicted alpha/beta-hydrolase family hydrolase|uniref:alpha/beta hydrolase family protein n=1 Tax=Paraburkholderia hospita TaxID=169430 RepID=UPI00296E9D9B|nr:alpha/beta hydrolase [Paraburkholderia hospita]
MQEVTIPVEDAFLMRTLALPQDAQSLVLLAHGSGRSRFSPRNQYVATELNRASIGTLLMELLSSRKTPVPPPASTSNCWRCVSQATAWIAAKRTTRLSYGYFGASASTGAAAAIRAAHVPSVPIEAIVPRGDRPDLAGRDALAAAQTPTLLGVSGLDANVIEVDREAFALLERTKDLVIVPGATHLFEVPGTLEAVARYAVQWFERYLGA